MKLSPKNRKLLLIAGSVLLVLILVAVALPLIVDVNRFRPELEQQLQSALGRKVQIGSIHLAFFSGGIGLEKVAIAEDPAFGSEPFVTAGSLNVGVEFFPLLFSKSVRIDSITLRQAQVRLVRAAAGKWNFSTLGAATPPAKAKPSTGERSAGSNSASRTVSIGSLKIVDGRVLVSSSPRATARAYDHVQLTAHNISYTSEIPFTLSANTPGSGKLKLEGKAGPINRANAAETPLNTNIAIEHMDLGATGFVEPSSGLAGTLDFNGTVRSDGTIARTEGKVKAERLRLVHGGAPARQPVSFDYASEYDLRRQSGTLTRGDIRTGNAAAKLIGNYQTQGDSTVVHMKLNAANMPLTDLQGILPAVGVVLPGGSSFKGGNVNANLAIDGPLENLVTNGPLNIANARLSGFSLASKMPGISAASGVKGPAETLIETLSSNLRVAPEGIRADNVNLVVRQLGTITGKGTVAANNALNFHMLAKLSQTGGILSGVSAIAALGKSKGEIPFLIQGTTSNPVFLPDVAGGLGNTAKTPAQGAEKGVGNVLQGLFGKKKKPPQ